MLPDNSGPYDPEPPLYGGLTPEPTQPFLTNGDQHIYSNNNEVVFNDGNAVANYGTDTNGYVPTNGILEGQGDFFTCQFQGDAESCEVISVTGTDLGGTYSFQGHNYFYYDPDENRVDDPFDGTQSESANYNLNIYYVGTDYVLVTPTHNATLSANGSLSNQFDVTAITQGTLVPLESDPHAYGTQLVDLSQPLDGQIDVGLFGQLAMVSTPAQLEAERLSYVNPVVRPQPPPAAVVKLPAIDQLQISQSAQPNAVQPSFVSAINISNCSTGFEHLDRPGLCFVPIDSGYFLVPNDESTRGDRTYANLQNFNNAVVDTVVAGANRYVDGSQAGAEYLSDSLSETVNTVSSEVDVLFSGDATTGERVEAFSTAIYSTSLGSLDAVFGTAGAYVGGALEPELDAALKEVAALTEQQFEQLSPTQQDAILSTIGAMQNWANQSPENQALVEVSGYVPASWLLKRIPQTQITSPAPSIVGLQRRATIVQSDGSLVFVTDAGSQIDVVDEFSIRYLSETGGRWGTAETRALNFEISNRLQVRGVEVTAGGGVYSEEYIPSLCPVVGTTSGCTFPDISAGVGSGQEIFIQTVSTLADGTPTRGELDAIARLAEQRPNAIIISIPKGANNAQITEILDANLP